MTRRPAVHLEEEGREGKREGREGERREKKRKKKEEGRRREVPCGRKLGVLEVPLLGPYIWYSGL